MYKVSLLSYAIATRTAVRRTIPTLSACGIQDGTSQTPTFFVSSIARFPLIKYGYH